MVQGIIQVSGLSVYFLVGSEAFDPDVFLMLMAF